jgi:beta-lactamase class A
MRVGMPNLAEILQSDRYRLYDPKRNGGLWVGRSYFGGHLWKRDPLHNISHGATAMQAARFYYLAATRRLVAPELFEDLREILSKPAITHKFVKGLKEKSPDARIFRKSGTWRQFHADSAVIVQPDYGYIVVSLVEHQAAKEGLSRLIVVVDDVVADMRGKKDK